MHRKLLSDPVIFRVVLAKYEMQSLRKWTWQYKLQLR